ncbi:hypothetical protein SAMN02745824_1372 [Parasphingorhabdus marina DSM 22363]|uniref:Uncharacterized protein n=1 Tax=Parasphingorhabdus marina DSM 22363 TaxID=1123272 RepID=A0A1N6D0R9_9SPHN|nr:hypothetical protein [Parasphingorhabdus marina]SIN64296.1 hypothetical protein SAMN02745824_1372 [Parasphingorhabdus marina DSM 22363]
MKILKILGIATGLMMTATPASAESDKGEIGYAKGALAYDALMAGKNEVAVERLEQAKYVQANDPARLINLGQAYARTGRMGDAAVMFQSAINSNRSLDLVLSDGTVINSRDAARLALRNLNNRVASR